MFHHSRKTYAYVIRSSMKTFQNVVLDQRTPGRMSARRFTIMKMQTSAHCPRSSLASAQVQLRMNLQKGISMSEPIDLKNNGKSIREMKQTLKIKRTTAHIILSQNPTSEK
ncbi:MAG: hypothetical protein B2I17_00090 [Thermoplasmatales archaeon B_DKE]|nr:MAG: hypothetical protein B2I17_00090 [Thermoplasmatales archaeon B_DKE]